MYDTYFFDFNGTILDDLDLCLEILNKMLKKRNYKTFNKEEYKKIFGFPIIDYYKKAGFDFDKYPFSELALEFINEYQKRSLDCHIYPKIIDLFKFLKKNNKNIIVLSASEKNNLIEQLKHFDIYKYFMYVLGIDNVHAKGKIDIALNFYNENKDLCKNACFIGDTIHDYEVSKKLNIDCILLCSGHQDSKRLNKLDCLVLDDTIKLYETIKNELEYNE